MDESQHNSFKKVSKYIEYNPIYINFRETCTTNELLSDMHTCGKIINKNEERKYVGENIKSVLKVTKMYFLSWVVGTSMIILLFSFKL